MKLVEVCGFKCLLFLIIIIIIITIIIIIKESQTRALMKVIIFMF